MRHITRQQSSKNYKLEGNGKNQKVLLGHFHFFSAASVNFQHHLHFFQSLLKLVNVSVSNFKMPEEEEEKERERNTRRKSFSFLHLSYLYIANFIYARNKSYVRPSKNILVVSSLVRSVFPCGF